jgi:hypothetical protein
MFLCFKLVHQYFILEETTGSPTFTINLYLHARLFDPGEATTDCPYMPVMVLPSVFFEIIGPLR